MLKHLILLIQIVLFCQQINAQQRFVKPEDVFPNNPQYRPTVQNQNKIKNPFSDTFNREDPDALFMGKV
jgi:hypothetical protein